MGSIFLEKLSRKGDAHQKLKPATGRHLHPLIILASINGGFWIFSLMTLTKNDASYMTCWGQQRKLLIPRSWMGWGCRRRWLPCSRPCLSAKLRPWPFQPTLWVFAGCQRHVCWEALVSDWPSSPSMVQGGWTTGKCAKPHPGRTLGESGLEA